MAKELIVRIDDALDHFSTKMNHVETFLADEKEKKLDEISAYFRQVLAEYIEEIEQNQQE